MRVLIVVGSRHGSTLEIAERIGLTLAGLGVDETVVKAEVADGVTGYDAVLLGSGVYVGQWLPSVREFVERFSTELARVPVWLFSSGPIGDPPRPTADKAVQVDEIMTATKAREHRLFAGKLDKDVLSFGERAIVFAVRGHDGDYREWDEITAWATEIANVLLGSVQPTP